MKKVIEKSLSVILAFAIIFSSAYVGLNEIDFSGLFAVEAEAASESDLTFGLNADSESYYVSGCDEEASGELIIPATYNGLPVTRIGTYSFSDCVELTSVTIPDSVTSIDDYAFRYCEGLKSVTIPNSVTSIGIHAFYECTSLASVKIPDSVTSIGENAFSGCTSLASITIADSVTSIGQSAFYNTAYYNTPGLWVDGVLYIGNHLIKANNTVSGAYTIKNGTKTLADSAFNSCTGLTSLVIPDSVTSIGGAVFYNCTNLADITISDNIAKMEENVFSYTAYYNDPSNWENGVLYISKYLLNAQKTISGSYSVKEGTKCISGSAFRDCTSLTSITIPESVTSVGDGAFYGCTSLTSITIPAGITSIGGSTFHKCTSLKNVYYTGLLSEWNSITIASGNDYLINADISHLCTYEEWTTDVEATCEEDGSKSSTCSVCEEKATEVVPALGHAYPDEWTTDVEATCEEDGSKSKTCPTCEDVQTEVVPALGHDYSDEWTIDVAPTCTEKGSKSHHCANCGDKKDVTEILANGHYYTDGVCSVCSENAIFEYTISDGCVEITKYIGTATEVVIPHKIDGYLVTSIGGSAFKGGTSLTAIEIPYTVEKIGWFAFEECTSLVSVKIPYGVKNIFGSTFNGCTSLTFVEIPDSVTEIGAYAFQDCSSLESIDIPNSVTTIGDTAFQGCTSLTSIIIPDSVTSIGSYAFQNCVNLTTATISAGLKNIPYRMFAYCENLKSVNLPDAAESIDDEAFSGCTSLTSIEIPDSVTSIGSYAFDGCTNLVSTIIPDGVTNIFSSTFRGCTSLTSVTIGSGVTSIDGYAFEDCENLESVYIKDIAAWCAIDFEYYNANPLYYADNLYVNGELVEDLVIPDGVTEIPQYAFSCTNITSVTIPGSVKSIASSAFYHCSSLETVYIKDLESWLNIEFANKASNPLCYAKNLYVDGELVTDIVIPESVTAIPDYAFYGCTSIKSFVIPNTVTTIGAYAFGDCSQLTSITIPDSVESIGDGAFLDCSALKTVEIGSGVTSIGTHAFDLCTNLENVYIEDIAKWCSLTFPRGDYTGRHSSNPLYYAKNLYVNGNLVTDLVIPDGVTTIPVYAFSCENITSVTIPDSVTTIDYYAFYGCTNLSAVEIPDSVTKMGYSAFNSCTSLVSVIIGDGVAEIDSNTFNGCSSLTSATIGNSVKFIGGSAFENCRNLVSVNIPASVSKIDPRAFSYCESLTKVNITDIGAWCEIEFYNQSSNPLYFAERLYINNQVVTDVVIPEGTTIINDWAFYNCKSLKSVSIPNTVTAIDTYAFYNCPELTTITIPDSVESIGDSAFGYCPGLKTVEIGSGVTSIGDAFGCEALELIKVSEENSYYSSVDGVLFNKNKTKLLIYPDSRVETAYTVPDTVVSFADYAFSNSNIKTVVLGAGCSSIPSKLFSSCNNLKNVIIPSEVTIIGNSAFASCYNIKDVYYEGTQEEWSAVCGGTDISYLSNGKLHYNVDVENWDKHYGEPEVTKAVTCTSNGSQKYTCPCGHVITETIYSTGHSYPEEWTIGSEPTCTDDGYRYKECANCDAQKTETIKATGHTETLWITELDPTCVASGYKDEYCLICGDIINSEIIPATGHEDSDEWIVDVEPTCTEEGSKYRYCTVCGEKGDTAVIEALGHDYEVVSVAEEHPHLTTFKCSRCPETKEEESYSQKCALCNFTFTDVDDETCKITGYIGSATSMVIPAAINGKTVTTTNTGAFKNNTTITSVKVETGIQSIGSLSFLNCSSLSKIVIPESVTSIGASAFRGCASDFTIYCYRDSYAMQYAIDNSIAYVIMDIGETANTTIDYENKLIYTTVDGSTSLSDIVYIPETSDTSVTASQVDGDNEYLGTGSIVTVVDDGVATEYTLIVDCDTNGDSVCDVLDCVAVERVSTGKAELSGAYAMAADGNADNMVDINDYQSIINKALVS